MFFQQVFSRVLPGNNFPTDFSAMLNPGMFPAGFSAAFYPGIFFWQVLSDIMIGKC
jgi:hypothetical protein